MNLLNQKRNQNFKKKKMEQSVDLNKASKKEVPETESDTSESDSSESEFEPESESSTEDEDRPVTGSYLNVIIGLTNQLANSTMHNIIPNDFKIDLLNDEITRLIKSNKRGDRFLTNEGLNIILVKVDREFMIFPEDPYSLSMSDISKLITKISDKYLLMASIKRNRDELASSIKEFYNSLYNGQMNLSKDDNKAYIDTGKNTLIFFIQSNGTSNDGVNVLFLNEIIFSILQVYGDVSHDIISRLLQFRNQYPSYVKANIRGINNMKFTTGYNKYVTNAIMIRLIDSTNLKLPTLTTIIFELDKSMKTPSTHKVPSNNSRIYYGLIEPLVIFLFETLERVCGSINVSMLWISIYYIINYSGITSYNNHVDLLIHKLESIINLPRDVNLIVINGLTELLKVLKESNIVTEKAPISSFEPELIESKKKIDELGSEISRLEKQLSESNNKSKADNNMIDTLKINYDTLLKENSSLKVENQSLTEKYNSLKLDSDKYKIESNEKISQMMTKMVSLGSEKEKLIKDIEDDSNKKINELTNQLTHIIELNDKQTQLHKNDENKIIELEQINNELSKKLSTQRQEIRNILDIIVDGLAPTSMLDIELELDPVAINEDALMRLDNMSAKLKNIAYVQSAIKKRRDEIITESERKKKLGLEPKSPPMTPKVLEKEFEKQEESPKVIEKKPENVIVQTPVNYPIDDEFDPDYDYDYDMDGERELDSDLGSDMTIVHMDRSTFETPDKQIKNLIVDMIEKNQLAYIDEISVKVQIGKSSKFLLFGQFLFKEYEQLNRFVADIKFKGDNEQYSWYNKNIPSKDVPKELIFEGKYIPIVVIARLICLAPLKKLYQIIDTMIQSTSRTNKVLIRGLSIPDFDINPLLDNTGTSVVKTPDIITGLMTIYFYLDRIRNIINSGNTSLYTSKVLNIYNFIKEDSKLQLVYDNIYTHLSKYYKKNTTADIHYNKMFKYDDSSVSIDMENLKSGKSVLKSKFIDIIIRMKSSIKYVILYIKKYQIRDNANLYKRTITSSNLYTPVAIGFKSGESRISTKNKFVF